MALYGQNIGSTLSQKSHDDNTHTIEGCPDLTWKSQHGLSTASKTLGAETASKTLVRRAARGICEWAKPRAAGMRRREGAAPWVGARAAEVWAVAELSCEAHTGVNVLSSGRGRGCAHQQLGWIAARRQGCCKPWLGWGCTQQRLPGRISVSASFCTCAAEEQSWARHTANGQYRRELRTHATGGQPEHQGLEGWWAEEEGA
ncbi:hypothetical protein DFH07DRAFT_771517 [Mycena maculata]|uniref:Uncharacterized protein n=1 Tax=Mycena maculata TaxID=230809 RepID=A0AAD7NHE8_9AGAR|nr:hypothetical protein DFH07DRAFT_771517 [Mycena maculata]